MFLRRVLISGRDPTFPMLTKLIQEGVITPRAIILTQRTRPPRGAMLALLHSAAQDPVHLLNGHAIAPDLDGHMDAPHVNWFDFMCMCVYYSPQSIPRFK